MSHKLRLGAILIRNGAKTISLQTSFGDLIIIRNSAKTISLQTSFGDLIIIIRNSAKTRSPQNFVWGLNNNNNKKKRSKHNMSPKLCLEAIIIIFIFTLITIFSHFLVRTTFLYALKNATSTILYGYIISEVIHIIVYPYATHVI
jgi:hypothetical protein